MAKYNKCVDCGRVLLYPDFKKNVVFDKKVDDVCQVCISRRDYVATH